MEVQCFRTQILSHFVNPVHHILVILKPKSISFCRNNA